MKVDHPRRKGAAAVSALLLLAAGCQSPQMAATSSNVAPDIVPPPATRMLLPGTAQPYYPGDPLPAMQTRGLGPTDPALAASDGWATSEPGVGEESSAVRFGASSPASGDLFLAGSNEPSVTIPGDGNSLRFALPAPQPTTLATGTPAATAPAASTRVAAQPASPVASAMYQQPLAVPPLPQPALNQQPPAAGGTSGLWRPPEIASRVGPTQGILPPTFQPTTVAPVVTQPTPVGGSTAGNAGPPDTMDVRLRAVPSPPPEPVESTAPRIRLPGYPAPPPFHGVHGSVQQTVLPASYVAVQPPPATFTSRDGFRPRGSVGQ